MPDIVVKIGLLALGAIVTFVAAWFWKHRDRVTKQEDDASVASRQENRELAKELATSGRATADKLETERKERSITLEEDQKLLVKRIEDLELAVVAIKTPVDLLWAVVQAKLIRDLTHPLPQFHEMDRLMRELKSQAITHEGRSRLEHLIDERIISTDPGVSDEEKVSAMLMKSVLEIERLKLP